jgi:hypothetical protein
MNSRVVDKFPVFHAVWLDLAWPSPEWHRRGPLHHRAVTADPRSVLSRDGSFIDAFARYGWTIWRTNTWLVLRASVQLPRVGNLLIGAGGAIARSVGHRAQAVHAHISHHSPKYACGPNHRCRTRVVSHETSHCRTGNRLYQSGPRLPAFCSTRPEPRARRVEDHLHYAQSAKALPPSLAPSERLSANRGVHSVDDV